MWPPSGVRHEMVYVVGPESGTVAAPPERVLCEKLPSGDVSVQDVTPTAFQNTVVRAPSVTEAGVAQISTFGGTIGVGIGVGVTDGFAAGFGVDLTVGVTGTGVGFGAPTLYPRNVHKLSKNDAGTMNEIKFAVHGREEQSCAMTPCGAPFAGTP